MKDIVKGDIYFWARKIIYTIVGFVACYVLNSFNIILSAILGTVNDIALLMLNSMLNIGMFMILALILLDGYYVGQIFQTRLINPQVIRAGRTYAILSKYCLVCLFNLLFAVMLYLAFLLTVFFLPGGSETMTELMNKKHVSIMIICLACIFIRLSVQFVSITTLVRSSGLSIVANYLYLVVPSMPALEMGQSDLGIWEFTRLFAIGQLVELLNAEDSMLMFGKVVITSLVSIVLWIFFTLLVFHKSDLR